VFFFRDVCHLSLFCCWFTSEMGSQSYACAGLPSPLLFEYFSTQCLRNYIDNYGQPRSKHKLELLTAAGCAFHSSADSGVEVFDHTSPRTATTVFLSSQQSHDFVIRFIIAVAAVLKPMSSRPLGAIRIVVICLESIFSNQCLNFFLSIVGQPPWGLQRCETSISGLFVSS
jgi:hypothetical protein